MFFPPAAPPIPGRRELGEINIPLAIERDTAGLEQIFQQRRRHALAIAFQNHARAFARPVKVRAVIEREIRRLRLAFVQRGDRAVFEFEHFHGVARVRHTGAGDFGEINLLIRAGDEAGWAVQSPRDDRGGELPRGRRGGGVERQREAEGGEADSFQKDDFFEGSSCGVHWVLELWFDLHPQPKQRGARKSSRPREISKTKVVGSPPHAVQPLRDQNAALVPP